MNEMDYSMYPIFRCSCFRTCQQEETFLPPSKLQTIHMHNRRVRQIFVQNLTFNTCHTIETTRCSSAHSEVLIQVCATQAKPGSTYIFNEILSQSVVGAASPYPSGP